MKKIVFLVLAFVLSISAVCFATDGIVTQSGESVTIDNYDDFYSAYTQGTTQAEIKEYYREFLAYSREQDIQNEPTKQFKAKVVDTNKTGFVYDMSYYTPYKVRVQTIKVEILEGEYTGKVMDAQFVLTTDTYNNLQLTDINIGDTIFVAINEDDDGTLTAYTTSHDTRIERFPMTAILVLITAVLIIIVGRVDGLKTLLLIALIFDLVFVITIPEMMKYNEIKTLVSTDVGFPSEDEISNDESITILERGENNVPTKVEVVVKNNSLVWLIIIDTVVICGAFLINKMGLSKDTLYAFAISGAVIIFIALLLNGVSILMKMNGNVLEAISLAENIINRNMDFNAIYMLTTLLIASIIVPNTVSKIIKDEKHNASKCVNNQILLVCIVSFSFIILKVMAMAIYRYGIREMINSEIISLEFIRILVLSIAILLVTGVSRLAIKKEKDGEDKNEL